jgi:hypothetical protein
VGLALGWVVDGCADGHAGGTGAGLVFYLGWAEVLVENAGWGAAVVFAQIGVVDFLICTWDGTESDIDVVSVNVTQIVKIWVSTL